MAKSPTVGRRERTNTTSHAKHPVGKRDVATGRVRRVILFPTEPSTLGHKKIDEAIERVISRKK